MKTKFYIFILVVGIIVFTGFSSIKSVGQDKESIKKFVTTFVEDFNSSDWAERVKSKYKWGDDGIRDQKVFRESFPDFKIKIKHLVVDGNEVVMWGEMSGTHVKEFPRGELAGFKATNKTVTWNEIWHFKIENGEFAGDWDWAIDGVWRMKQLGVKCLPENF